MGTPRSGGTRERRPVLLAVAGDSASGKTTLTRGLVGALGGDGVSALCVDAYHRYDREERKGLPFTPLNPACNYLGIMEQHLQLVATGEPILMPVYDHERGTLQRPVMFEPDDHVIVEGLFPLHSRRSRACFDLSVYLNPPEAIRRAWKIKRDTRDRAYQEEQVIEDLRLREPDSAAFIRPQRRWADIVVTFAPAEGSTRGRGDALSATILMRPTAPHPDFSDIFTEDTREAVHLKLARDDDGRPVDALYVHAHASREITRLVEMAIWTTLGIEGQVPNSLGVVEPGVRSEPLAVVQLILLYHLLLAHRVKGGDADVIPTSAPTGPWPSPLTPAPRRHSPPRNDLSGEGRCGGIGVG
ncbi:MAG: phosphoribulokinase [Actinomycetota bacterium]|nr:phosphoribulokinase [Actinomycetota bacterium]